MGLDDGGWGLDDPKSSPKIRRLFPRPPPFCVIAIKIAAPTTATVATTPWSIKK